MLNERQDLASKDSDRVLGVFLNGEAKAYPLRIPDWQRLGGDPVRVVFDRRTKTARAEGNNSVIYVVSFLDDLKALFSETEIYRAGRRSAAGVPVASPGAVTTFLPERGPRLATLGSKVLSKRGTSGWSNTSAATKAAMTTRN